MSILLKTSAGNSKKTPNKIFKENDRSITIQIWFRFAIFTLREKCPNTEFFLIRILLYSDWIRIESVNLRIHSEYRKMRTRKNSLYGHFSGSVTFRFFSSSAKLLVRKPPSKRKNEIYLTVIPNFLFFIIDSYKERTYLLTCFIVGLLSSFFSYLFTRYQFHI